MAEKEYDISKGLAKLTLKSETLRNDDVVPKLTNSGYSFECSMSLDDLTNQRLTENFFQKLLDIVENQMKIDDFHMRLRNRKQHGFIVDIQYKDVDNRTGPVHGDTCISCDMTNDLSQFSLIKQNSTTRIWLDAQLRNKFIITPRRHIERLSEMSTDEMTKFWYDVQVFLNEEGCHWSSMVLNHGKYRNHFHLHMKINIDQQEWNRHIQKKYKEKIQRMTSLYEHDSGGIIQKNFGNRSFNQWSGISRFTDERRNKRET